ncbi:hypothetical protein GJU40_01535 [Bacillus lacus]|uniref:HK97 gp10 family phage protein n=1 Tax=Metabacillus lacus TaxID=1983721 RepID=A0A7X2IW23_9BACI|nr:hypothetical protein [Metabacillus lacus]MRX70848.1 hypothetical protein [Metabacillus lacus]
MTVRITGMNRVLNELNSRLGPARVQVITDIGLRRGARKFVEELEKEFLRFKDTGASIDEITIADPVSIMGVRTIRVHWKGPKGRYRVIHLNEFGTVKNPNPQGKGAVARAMRNAQRAYQEAIKQAIREGM